MTLVYLSSDAACMFFFVVEFPVTNSLWGHIRPRRGATKVRLANVEQSTPRYLGAKHTNYKTLCGDCCTANSPHRDFELKVE